MPIGGSSYVWGEKAEGVDEKPGVYAFYDKNQVLIYIGESSNLRERFTYYLSTNFSEDPCKRDTKFYKREFTAKHKEREDELLKEFQKEHGKYPKCNKHL